MTNCSTNQPRRGYGVLRVASAASIRSPQGLHNHPLLNGNQTVEVSVARFAGAGSDAEAIEARVLLLP